MGPCMKEKLSDTVYAGRNSAEGNASEGEGVPSSIDAGLRLSPCSENITLSEKMYPNHANGDDGTALISAPVYT